MSDTAATTNNSEETQVTSAIDALLSENDPKKRWREHLGAARNNPVMVISKAIRKHGPTSFHRHSFKPVLEANRASHYHD